MNTLDYIVDKWNLDIGVKHMPIEIPNVGRDDLARLFAELEFKNGVEVGVDQGAYTAVLCRENPQASIAGVDAWQCYPGYREHLTQSKMDELYERAKARVAQYHNCMFFREFSLEAVKRLPDEWLDFVYIDASHKFEDVVNDIAAWSRKVKRGGIVSGHDYRTVKNDYDLHVIEAVNGFTRAHQIRPWFVLGSKAKVEGQVRDNSRSWMWVKQ